MSFQTGGATDPVNLLAQFKVFLVAAGWTADQDFAQGTGRVVSVHKGTKFITMRSFINEGGVQLGQSGATVGSGIAIIAHTAAWVDPTDTRWWNQGGAPTLANQTAFNGGLTCIMFTPAGVITNYWMFADAAGDNVVLVGFKTAGVYSHLYFGDIIKVQAWVGSGVYFGASSAMNGGVLDADGTSVMPAPPAAIASNKAIALLKCDVDSWVGKWVSLTHQSGLTSPSSSGKGMQATAHRVGASDEQFDNIGFWSLRTNAASSRTGALIMLPILWLVERDFGGALAGGGYSLVGTIPNIFQAQTAGFVPGAAFTISTDPYIVFPGYAIRKFP
jgi:hypothetical protein